MARSSLFLLSAAAGLLVGGCADNGPFPSLALRPAEKAYAAELDAPEPAPPVLPDDPAVAARLGGFIAEAEAGEAEFERAASLAAALAARAGARGSDSWVEAQQAVSRASVARRMTTNALAGIDAYTVERGSAGGLSEADLARIAAAASRVQAIAQRQADRIAVLEAALRRG